MTMSEPTLAAVRAMAKAPARMPIFQGPLREATSAASTSGEENISAGDTIVQYGALHVKGGPEFQGNYAKARSYLTADETMHSVIMQIEDGMGADERNWPVALVKKCLSQQGDAMEPTWTPSTFSPLNQDAARLGTICWNPGSMMGINRSTTFSSALTLAHEFIHAHHFLDNAEAFYLRLITHIEKMTNLEEKSTIETINTVALKLNETTADNVRQTHSGLPIATSDPVATQVPSEADGEYVEQNLYYFNHGLQDVQPRLNEMAMLSKQSTAHVEYINEQKEIIAKFSEKRRHQQILLKPDELENINTKDAAGLTPLMFAVDALRADVVSILLKRGANVHLKDDNGLTVLMRAACSQNADIVNELILHHANVNERTPSGNTALIYAAMGGNNDIVHLLLQKGAAIDAPGVDRNTALIWSVLAGSADVVKTLLHHGADATLPNRHGETALSIAREAEEDEILELLKAYR